MRIAYADPPYVGCGQETIDFELVKEALAEIESMRDRVHSEEFCVMFLGYLTARMPELHSVEAPRLMAAWQGFKREMGKSG